jgi:methylmalonyl-CoA/ethylmalonyl-CoA epimerase
MPTNDLDWGRFHHVGVAVRDIRTAAERFCGMCGAVVESEVFHDPQQKVRVQFLKLGDLRIELIEPADAPSPLDSMLQRGVSLYQVCLEVGDLDATLACLREARVVLLSPPKPAVAFGGRRVAFVMCQSLVIELLECGQEKTGSRPPPAIQRPWDTE